MSKKTDVRRRSSRGYPTKRYSSAHARACSAHRLFNEALDDSYRSAYVCTSCRKKFKNQYDGQPSMNRRIPANCKHFCCTNAVCINSKRAFEDVNQKPRKHGKKGYKSDADTCHLTTAGGKSAKQNFSKQSGKTSKDSHQKKKIPKDEHRHSNRLSFEVYNAEDNTKDDKNRERTSESYKRYSAGRRVSDDQMSTNLDEESSKVFNAENNAKGIENRERTSESHKRTSAGRRQSATPRSTDVDNLSGQISDEDDFEMNNTDIRNKERDLKSHQRTRADGKQSATAKPLNKDNLKNLTSRNLDEEYSEVFNAVNNAKGVQNQTLKNYQPPRPVRKQFAKAGSLNVYNLNEKITANTDEDHFEVNNAENNFKNIKTLERTLKSHQRTNAGHKQSEKATTQNVDNLSDQMSTDINDEIYKEMPMAHEAVTENGLDQNNLKNLLCNCCYCNVQKALSMKQRKLSNGIYRPSPSSSGNIASNENIDKRTTNKRNSTDAAQRYTSDHEGKHYPEIANGNARRKSLTNSEKPSLKQRQCACGHSKDQRVSALDVFVELLRNNNITVGHDTFANELVSLTSQECMYTPDLSSCCSSTASAKCDNKQYIPETPFLDCQQQVAGNIPNVQQNTSEGNLEKRKFTNKRGAAGSDNQKNIAEGKHASITSDERHSVDKNKASPSTEVSTKRTSNTSKSSTARSSTDKNLVTNPENDDQGCVCGFSPSNNQQRISECNSDKQNSLDGSNRHSSDPKTSLSNGRKSSSISSKTSDARSSIHKRIVSSLESSWIGQQPFVEKPMGKKRSTDASTRRISNESTNKNAVNDDDEGCTCDQQYISERIAENQNPANDILETSNVRHSNDPKTPLSSGQQNVAEGTAKERNSMDASIGPSSIPLRTSNQQLLPLSSAEKRLSTRRTGILEARPILNDQQNMDKPLPNKHNSMDSTIKRSSVTSKTSNEKSSADKNSMSTQSPTNSKAPSSNGPQLIVEITTEKLSSTDASDGRTSNASKSSNARVNSDTIPDVSGNFVNQKVSDDDDQECTCDSEVPLLSPERLDDDDQECRCDEYDATTQYVTNSEAPFLNLEVLNNDEQGCNCDLIQINATVIGEENMASPGVPFHASDQQCDDEKTIDKSKPTDATGRRFSAASCDTIDISGLVRQSLPNEKLSLSSTDAQVPRQVPCPYCLRKFGLKGNCPRNENNVGTTQHKNFDSSQNNTLEKLTDLNNSDIRLHKYGPCPNQFNKSYSNNQSSLNAKSCCCQDKAKSIESLDSETRINKYGPCFANYLPDCHFNKSCSKIQSIFSEKSSCPSLDNQPSSAYISAINCTEAMSKSDTYLDGHKYGPCRDFVNHFGGQDQRPEKPSCSSKKASAKEIGNENNFQQNINQIYDRINTECTKLATLDSALKSSKNNSTSNKDHKNLHTAKVLPNKSQSLKTNILPAESTVDGAMLDIKTNNLKSQHNDCRSSSQKYEYPTKEIQINELECVTSPKAIKPHCNNSIEKTNSKTVAKINRCLKAYKSEDPDLMNFDRQNLTTFCHSNRSAGMAEVSIRITLENTGKNIPSTSHNSNQNFQEKLDFNSIRELLMDIKSLQCNIDQLKEASSKCRNFDDNKTHGAETLGCRCQKSEPKCNDDKHTPNAFKKCSPHVKSDPHEKSRFLSGTDNGNVNIQGGIPECKSFYVDALSIKSMESKTKFCDARSETSICPRCRK